MSENLEEMGMGSIGKRPKHGESQVDEADVESDPLEQTAAALASINMARYQDSNSFLESQHQSLGEVFENPTAATHRAISEASHAVQPSSTRSSKARPSEESVSVPPPLYHQKKHGKHVPAKFRGTKKGGNMASQAGTVNSSKKRKLKRRTSNISAQREKRKSAGGSSISNTSRTVPVQDDAPDRIVNPLLELVAAPNSQPSAADMIPLYDVWFPRPDTYSVAYAARLLGFDVPVVAPSTAVVTLTTSWPLLRNYSSTLSIPDSGRTLPALWEQYQQGSCENDPIWQESTVDPLYVSLIRQPELGRLLVTPAQQSRLLSSLTDEIMLPVLDLAKSKGGGSEWTWSSLADFHERNPEKSWPSSLDTISSGIYVLSDNLPIGLVSYRFEWHPLSHDTSEVILSLDGLSTADDISYIGQNATTHHVPESETRLLLVTLICLALEHARASHVWYATITVPHQLRDFFVRYFRMVPIEAAKDCSLEGKARNTTTTAAKDSRQTRTSAGHGQFPENDDKCNVGPRNSIADVDSGKEVPGDKLGLLVARCSMSENVMPSADSKHAKMDFAVFSATTSSGLLQHKSINNTWTGNGIQEPDGNATSALETDDLKSSLKSEIKSLQKNKTLERQDVDIVGLVCDLNRCSYRYAFLMLTEAQEARDSASNYHTQHEASQKQRWLVQMPSVDEARATHQNAEAPSTCGSTIRTKRAPTRKSVHFFTNPESIVRDVSVRFRGKVKDENKIEFFHLEFDGELGPKIIASRVNDGTKLDVMRAFSPPSSIRTDTCTEDDEILRHLLSKKKQLEEFEGNFEPALRSILRKIVEERTVYESPETVEQRNEEKNILYENKRMLQRRKEMDKAVEKQREQDMDAVCDICNDGEVTPDNQILFCEACNVAVHQFCYGIERIPAGDYYCLACRYLGRDKLDSAPAPLPIRCELCCKKEGAYIRTAAKSDDVSLATFGKWVHMVCAKWQGLNFVDESSPDLIEDVSELKLGFRQLNISCYLCLAERGAMNVCRHAGCKRWIHVTCARAVGTCNVVHGENVKGPVEVNPWTLLCPEHSSVPVSEVPKHSLSTETLISIAQEFPIEPKPAPAPIALIPFNTANEIERKALLANKAYEAELLVEITMKKLSGVRCEVCDQAEENGIGLTRCSGCAIIFCASCKLDVDCIQGNYKCPRCIFVETAIKEGRGFTTPSCIACYQQGGWLRASHARPVSKKSYWKHNPREFEKSLFGRQLWCHTLCAFWHKQLILSPKTGEIDLSDVVMSSGRGLIKGNTFCFLCGQSGGLKLQCDNEGCHTEKNNRKSHTCFHVTCARQAGLEVEAYDIGRKMHFYVKCYRHGGNEFNLRARLEDMIEKEKRRAGKTFARVDSPMTFAHASRLLNSAILVLRIFGWAWRWAEWWVDYDSSWEPLLEPGEVESDMTKEELKIVTSSRDSRCEDARQCRLAAFGAALRNRCYDTEDDFDREALDRALLAVLSTPSLVGPLEDFEKEFFVDWLGRAYRSKSRILGFGEDKISVSSSRFCAHIDGGTPKHELGTRPTPGTQSLQKGKCFEEHVEETDDFLKTSVMVDDIRSCPRRDRAATSESSPVANPSAKVGEPSIHSKKRPGRPPSVDPSNFTERAPCLSPKRKRPGRPRKYPRPLDVSISNPKRISSPAKSKRERPQPIMDAPVFSPPPIEAKLTLPPSASVMPPLIGNKRKRGRPPKSGKTTPIPHVSTSHPIRQDPSVEFEIVKRTRRGRPPKNLKPDFIEESTDKPTLTNTNDLGNQFESEQARSSMEDELHAMPADKIKGLVHSMPTHKNKIPKGVHQHKDSEEWNRRIQDGAKIECDPFESIRTNSTRSIVESAIGATDNRILPMEQATSSSTPTRPLSRRPRRTLGVTPQQLEDTGSAFDVVKRRRRILATTYGTEESKSTDTTQATRQSSELRNGDDKDLDNDDDLPIAKLVERRRRFLDR